jgi:hypothetical protein
MEEAVGKRRRIGSIRGSRVSRQRGSFESGHAGTLLLITPRAGLLRAYLDCFVECGVPKYLGFCPVGKNPLATAKAGKKGYL